MTKRYTLRLLSLLLIAVMALSSFCACAGRGKTLLSLDRDGISVSFSVNEYELMLSRIKGTLSQYQYQVNDQSFWNQKDKFDGTNFQTLNEYYKASVLNNCRNYLVALYLFEAEGLELSQEAYDNVADLMDELIRTDGDGSKTKLNSLLAAYGVNYDILEGIYLMQEKISALQLHLYGKNASLIGANVKEEYLNENYVHFQQIFLPKYSYVYETDKNGDTIYYYDEESSKKGHICYDTGNGVPGTKEDGTPITDEKGDTVYFVNDGQFKTIAYDSVHGIPSHVMEKDGKSYKTKFLTEEELKELTLKAEALNTTLQSTDYKNFEKIMTEENDAMGTPNEYLDGYYLKSGLDYEASGEDYAYLNDIIKKLETMKDGDVALVSSTYGFHVIKKYPHTEKAYEKEENTAWFEDFNTSLIDALFLELCQSYYGDIQLNEKVWAATPDMLGVGINYYY